MLALFPCRYKSDLALCKPGNWLNDHCIDFWFEWIRTHRFHDKPWCCFLDPCVAYFLQSAAAADPEDVEEMLNPLHLGEKRMIFLPINNRSFEVKSGGGSHWSLLVFDREGGPTHKDHIDGSWRQSRGPGIFEHYDTAGGMNADCARVTAQRLAPHVMVKKSKDNPMDADEVPPAEHQLPAMLRRRTAAKPSDFLYHNRPSPKQRNGSDCGAFVLAMASELGARGGMRAGQSDMRYNSPWMCEEITQDTASQYRKWLWNHAVREIARMHCDPEHRKAGLMCKKSWVRNKMMDERGFFKYDVMLLLIDAWQRKDPMAVKAHMCRKTWENRCLNCKRWENWDEEFEIEKTGQVNQGRRRARDNNVFGRRRSFTGMNKAPYL